MFVGSLNLIHLNCFHLVLGACQTTLQEVWFSYTDLPKSNHSISISFTRLVSSVWSLNIDLSWGCLWNPFSSHSDLYLLPRSITHAFGFYHHYIIIPKSTCLAQAPLELLIPISNCLFGISNWVS